MVKRLNSHNRNLCTYPAMRHTLMHTHAHTYDCSSLAWLFTLVSVQVCRRRTEWKRNKTTPHTMKRGDSSNQSLDEVGALRCMSGSNYGSKGKRIKLLSHPGVPLVGLMLLAILPFGASIKQTVPRVKLSHRGKKYCLLILLLLHIYVFYTFSIAVWECDVIMDILSHANNLCHQCSCT